MNSGFKKAKCSLSPHLLDLQHMVTSLAAGKNSKILWHCLQCVMIVLCKRLHLTLKMGCDVL